MMTRKQFGELIHHFAEWQKQKDKQLVDATQKISYQHGYDEGRLDMREEMMKDSIEVQVYPTERPDLVAICQDGIILDKTKFQSGDKVKIIIVKN